MSSSPVRDANDETRTIGRKRPYQASDDNATYSEPEEQSEVNGFGETPVSNKRNNGSLRFDALHEPFNSAASGTQSSHGSDLRVPPVLEPGENAQNASFLVSTSNSETNHNGLASESNDAFASRAASNQFPLPAPPQQPLSQLGEAFPAAGMEQVYPSSVVPNEANPASLTEGAGTDAMNLYQLGLIQQMQQSLCSQQGSSMNPANLSQGGPNQGVFPMFPEQAAIVNPFLGSNPYSRFPYQPQTAAAEAQRMQLAGFMSGGAPSAASLPIPTDWRGQAASFLTSRGASVALPGYAPGGYGRIQPPRQSEGPILYMPSDDEILSDQQVLLRKQIEFFAADDEEVDAVTPGRRKEIVKGQVGIRCKYCAHIPIHYRTKGTVYYPAKLKGIYQAAQNMAVSHLCEACAYIDPYVKAELRAYQHVRSSSGHGGKQYWADSARVQGVIETEDKGLKFDPARIKRKERSAKSDKK